MLVLSRRVGEEIVIGDTVRVTIVSMQNQRVKVGITAPIQVTVHREEVHQRIQDSNYCPTAAE
jgi:carbon storage regulator